MKTCVAVLTYRRLGPLKRLLEGLNANLSACPLGIFEDCANFDDTAGFLTVGAEPLGRDGELEAHAYRLGGVNRTAFLGTRNLGVAGNSNRALRWFMRQTDCDHLLLCNDDLIVEGDVAAEYARAHTTLKVGLFSFCDFKDPEYAGPVVKVLGIDVRMVMRMTGMMMSVTRAVVERIGYFDPTFGRFGQEHCDYQNRAKFSGFSDLRGKPQMQLDIVSKTLRSSGDASSITPSEKRAFDQYSDEALRRTCAMYQTRAWYRPFRLLHGSRAGAYGGVGIPVGNLEELGYELVVDYDLKDAVATI